MSDILIQTDPRAYAAIKAALSMLSAEMQAEAQDGQSFEPGNLMTEGGTLAPLNTVELQELIDILGSPAPSYVIVDHIPPLVTGNAADLEEDDLNDGDPESVLFFSVQDGWGDLSCARHYTSKDVLDTELPMGCDVRWLAVHCLIAPPYRRSFVTQADLVILPGFEDLASDTNGTPCVWQNDYACICGTTWSEAWSDQSNDRCPSCRSETQPAQSRWLGPRSHNLQDLWQSVPAS